MIELLWGCYLLLWARRQLHSKNYWLGGSYFNKPFWKILHFLISWLLKFGVQEYHSKLIIQKFWRLNRSWQLEWTHDEKNTFLIIFDCFSSFLNIGMHLLVEIYNRHGIAVFVPGSRDHLDREFDFRALLSVFLLLLNPNNVKTSWGK